jgi:hypothetical protein
MKNLTDIGSPIKVIYRMFYANHHSELQFDADIFNKVCILNDQFEGLSLI